MARVLIVEDEPDIKDVIGDLLVLEGHEVHTLGRIPHGLDALRQLAPDVIVLDLRLPGMGGVELLRLLAADRQLRSTPVLICSGAGDLREAHAEEFAALGCEVIPKPFEIDDLVTALSQLLSRTERPNVTKK